MNRFWESASEIFRHGFPEVRVDGRFRLVFWPTLLLLFSSAFPQSQWTWRNPLPQGNSLNAVAWTGTQFVAVGDKGTILTSPDGTAWVRRNSGTDLKLNAVAGAGSQIVAAGDHGTILTSPNGVTWTLRASGTTADLSSLAWTGSQILGVGSEGTILSSTDGVAWAGRVSGTTARLKSVIWAGTQFIAVGETRQTWESEDVGSGVILTSQTGLTWAFQTSEDVSMANSVAWANDSSLFFKYFAVGFDAPFGAVFLMSFNGEGWTPNSSLLTDAPIQNFIIRADTQFVSVGRSGSLYTSSRGGETWTARASGTTVDLNSVAWSGTQLIAVGGNGVILKSTNGSAWTPSSISKTPATLESVVWSGTQCVAVGTDAYWNTSGSLIIHAGVLASPDCITWTEKDLSGIGNEFFLKKVVWTGTRFVAVGGGVVLTSTDGTVWDRQDLPGVDLNSVIWTGSKLVAVGGVPFSAQGALLTSLDGLTWSEPASVPGWLHDIAWTGTQYVGIYGDGNGAILTSPDGMSWTFRDSLQVEGDSRGLTSIAWTGSKLIAVGLLQEYEASTIVYSGGIALTSSDGITWSRHKFDSVQTLSSVHWTGTQAIATEETGKVLTSPDGVNWTAYQSGSPTLEAATWTGSLFVATGGHGAILTAPLETTKVGSKANGVRNPIVVRYAGSVVAVTLPQSLGREGRFVIYSPDGQSVAEGSLSGKANSFTIPAGNLKSGAYVLELRNRHLKYSRVFSVVQ